MELPEYSLFNLDMHFIVSCHRFPLMKFCCIKTKHQWIQRVDFSFRNILPVNQRRGINYKKQFLIGCPLCILSLAINYELIRRYKMHLIKSNSIFQQNF